ncbi:MAG: phosphohistidine phosphatase SixA [Verrucomicrobia bacterium]|nr:MAG: phosphohistidine phosphatase SixA [Verrucomicrobiota bacterium]
MKLYILRHAEAAEPSDARYANDAARPLTAKGIKRTRQLANALRQMEITFDVIFSSPLVRARQTAEIVARSLMLEKNLRVINQLSPSSAYVDLIAQIEHVHHSVEAVMLVGHEPHLSGLISLLCTGGGSLALTLKKGGLARLELETVKAERCASLEWLLSPRHFGPKRSSSER